MTFPWLICFFPWLPFSHGFRYGYDCISQHARQSQTRKLPWPWEQEFHDFSMTFWEIFIFQDFSMTFHDSNFFQDFPWPWEPCNYPLVTGPVHSFISHLNSLWSIHPCCHHGTGNCSKHTQAFTVLPGTKEVEKGTHLLLGPDSAGMGKGLA